MPTRRKILARAASLGFASLALGRSSIASAQEDQALRIPELIDSRSRNQSVFLEVQHGRTAFFGKRPTATLGYNGSYLGPTLRLNRGDEVEIEVRNSLRTETTVHWHGLLIPGPVDGGPHQPIQPGATWRPRLAVDQPAATLMYHSHLHGKTAEQVYSGLAGVLIISDETERALGLPSEYGVDDLPLVIQDRVFDREGQLIYPNSPMDLMMGVRGETILVNGTANPVARVPRRLVRLRLVNASNARVYDLAFDDGRAFHWIASEGGLLERPVELRTLRLAPGERVEVVVDFSDGRAVTMETGPDDNLPMMSMHMGFGRTGRQTVLRFQPETGGDGSRNIIPEQLVSHGQPDASSAVRRRLVLTMGMGMMGGGRMGHGMGGGMMGGGMMMGRGMNLHGINGRAFDMNRIDQRIGLGDVDIWEVSGEMMGHPFHIHGVQFQVLSRNGAAPSSRDQGLRDTVLVEDPVELLVHFTQPTLDQPFVYHCHILEHEDNGMMGQFLVH